MPFSQTTNGLAGDFLQLPPVPETHKGGGGGGGAAAAGRHGGGAATPDIKFCFEAQAWNEAVYACVELRRVFRQRDMAFVTMLNELRVGLVTPATLRAIASSGAEVDELKRVGGLPRGGDHMHASISAVTLSPDVGRSTFAALCGQPRRRSHQRH